MRPLAKFDLAQRMTEDFGFSPLPPPGDVVSTGSCGESPQHSEDEGDNEDDAAFHTPSAFSPEQTVRDDHIIRCEQCHGAYSDDALEP